MLNQIQYQAEYEAEMLRTNEYIDPILAEFSEAMARRFETISEMAQAGLRNVEEAVDTLDD